VVKMLAFVASSDDFYEQPKVMNASTELLITIFGDKAGRPARSAIGTNVLPGNIPVEIELVIEI
jgi:enamine deaminase RidA (YjgF/YER057c/UK114 family)